MAVMGMQSSSTGVGGQARGLVVALVVAACGPKPGAPESGETSAGTSSGDAGETTDSTTSTSASTSPTSATGAEPTGAATTTDVGTTTTTTMTETTTATTGEASGTTGSSGPISCGAKIYDCGNGEDDDGDGKIDLADPECTSPCDGDEGSFQTALPSGGADCLQDCFWDANWGVGDDGCQLKLKCDPLGPALPACAFDPDAACGPNKGVQLERQCLANCLPTTPNGCDCLGCCHVLSGGQTIDVYLGSSPECRLDNLGGCAPCSFHDECANPCAPEDCELCFGQPGLPPGCAAPGCPNGEPCTIDELGVSSCAPGMYCVTGCCAPATW